MRTTFARNSEGYTRNRSGLWVPVADNTLRRDHDPITLQPLGALIERQSTNEWPYSDDLSQLKTVNVIVDGEKLIATDRKTGHLFILRGLKEGQKYWFSYNLRPAGISFITFSRDGPHLDLRTGEVSDKNLLNSDGVDGISNVSAVVQTDGSTRLVFRSVFGGGLPETYLNDTSTSRGDGASGIIAKNLSVDSGASNTSPIYTSGQARTRAPDFLDAPGAQNTYGPGQHTWQGAVRMSHDPGEPTIIGHGDGRIYARAGRLYLDGPGELIQPERDFAPGEIVPFAWSVEMPGATPDIALGRSIDDTNWWNGHLVDIVPWPRLLRADEIARHLERTS